MYYRLKPYLAVSLIGMVAFCLYLVWNGSEDERINRRFSHLLGTCEIVVRRTPAQIEEQLIQISGYFTEDCKVQFVPGGGLLVGKDTVLDFSRNVLSDAHKINFITTQREVKVAPDQIHAELRSMIMLKALTGKDDELTRGTAYCQVFWIKRGKEWKIEQILLPLVQPPPFE